MSLGPPRRRRKGGGRCVCVCVTLVCLLWCLKQGGGEGGSAAGLVIMQDIVGTWQGRLGRQGRKNMKEA